MATFMAAFLVGGLWYIFGIGEAIVYRQELQAGADAAAFTGAVYHARGMNVIAMVNVVMGSVMAIKASAAMLAQVAALVISVATTMCELSKQEPYNLPPPDEAVVMDYSEFDFACDAITPAKDLMVKMKDVVKAVSADTDVMLVSLTESQKQVARTTPWLGSSEGAGLALAHAPYVTGGGVGSVSMVPTDVRPGLPVQEEPFEKACNRGKAIVPKLVDILVPSVLDPILKFMDFDMAGKLPNQICAGAGAPTEPWQFFDKDDVCEDFKKPKEKKECEDKLEEEKEDVPEVEPLEVVADKTTKGIYAQARNGNDYMQVYAVVRGAQEKLQRSDKGVEAPGWGAATVAGPGSTFEDLAIAQAEFYFDQTPEAVAADTCWEPCPAGLTWPSYQENTLWNLRWRARLRRYRVPQAVETNVLTSAIPPLGDVAYTDGIATFNGAVGIGPELLGSTVVADTLGGDASAFIGAGTAVVH